MPPKRNIKKGPQTQLSSAPAVIRKKTPDANTYQKFISLVLRGKHLEADVILQEYDVNQSFWYPIEGSTKTGYSLVTFLFLAIIQKHIQAIEKIARLKDIDLSYRHPKLNQTLFNIVSQTNNSNIAKILFINGAPVDLSVEIELCRLFILIGENDFDEELLRKTFLGPARCNIDSDDKWSQLLINVIFKDKKQAFDIIVEGIEKIGVTQSMPRYVGAIPNSYYFYKILDLLGDTDFEAIVSFTVGLMNYVELTVEQLTSDKIKKIIDANPDDAGELKKILERFKNESYALFNLSGILTYIKNNILSDGHRTFPILVASLVNNEDPISRLKELLKACSDQEIRVALLWLTDHRYLQKTIENAHAQNLTRFFNRLSPVLEEDAELREKVLQALDCESREDLEKKIDILRPNNFEIAGALIDLCFPVKREEVILPEVESPPNSPVYSPLAVDLVKAERQTALDFDLRLEGAINTLAKLIEQPEKPTKQTGSKKTKSKPVTIPSEQSLAKKLAEAEKEKRNFELVKDCLIVDHGIAEFEHVIYQSLVKKTVGELAGACKEFFDTHANDSSNWNKLSLSKTIVFGRRDPERLKEILELFYSCKLLIEFKKSNLTNISCFGSHLAFINHQRARIAIVNDYVEAIMCDNKPLLAELLKKLKIKADTQFSTRSILSEDRRTNQTTLTTKDEEIALGKQIITIQKKLDQFFPDQKIQANGIQFHPSLEVLTANFGKSNVEQNGQALSDVEKAKVLLGSFDTDILRSVNGIAQVVEQKEYVPKGKTYEETIWEEGIKFLKIRFVLVHALILAQEYGDYSLIVSMQVKHNKQSLILSVDEKIHLFEIFTSIEMWRVRFGIPTSDPKKCYKDKLGNPVPVPAEDKEKKDLYLELLGLLSEELFEKSPVRFSRALDCDVGCDDVSKAIDKAKAQLQPPQSPKPIAAQEPVYYSATGAGPAGVRVVVRSTGTAMQLEENLGSKLSRPRLNLP